jgi:hypothetical protein
MFDWRRKGRVGLFVVGMMLYVPGFFIWISLLG